MNTESIKSAVPDEDILLSLNAFVRSIGGRRTASHALFLGAGASVTVTVREHLSARKAGDCAALEHVPRSMNRL